MGDLSTLTLLLVGQSLLRFVLLLFGFSLKPNLYLHMVSLAAKIFWSRIHYLSGVVWPQTVFQYIQHHMTWNQFTSCTQGSTEKGYGFCFDGLFAFIMLSLFIFFFHYIIYFTCNMY